MPARAKPFLFLDPHEIARLRERIKRVPWARQAWADIRRAATPFLRRRIRIPSTGGGCGLDFICFDCRLLLEPDPGREGGYRCRKCQRQFRGPAYDAGHVNFRHHELAQAAQDLALVGIGEQDDRFLHKAKEILLGYAAAVSGYPRVAGKAIVSGLHSEEAMTFLPLTFAYDLLRGASVLSTFEKGRIEQNLLFPVMEDMRLGLNEGGSPLSNHAQWALVGAAIVALALNDSRAFRAAAASPAGFEAAFARGLRDDGHWWEGSPVYHLHMLWGLLFIAEVSRHTGHNLYATEYSKKLREMVLAPLRLAGPDDALPAINDSNRLTPAEMYQPALCELALARFGDPACAAVLHRVYGRDPRLRSRAFCQTAWGHPRTAFFPIALLSGVDEIPPGKPVARRSRVLLEQGFVRLGGDPGFEKPYLLFNYGAQDAGHKHADRLGFLYEYDGVPLLADSGYGFANWKSTTIAHNTVVVDERSHGPSGGTLRGFLDLPWVKLLHATAPETCLAQGVTLERAQALLPDCLIDVFHVRGDREHTFDYLLHSPFEWRATIATRKVDGTVFGSRHYQPLQAREAGKTSSAWSCRLGNAEVLFPIGRPTEISIARTKADLHLLARRRKSSEAVFVSVVLPVSRARGEIVGVRKLSPPGQDRWIALELRRRNGTRVVFSRDLDPTLPPRRLGPLAVRAPLTVLLLDRDGKLLQKAQLLSSSRLTPEAAAMLPGTSRRFVLHSDLGRIRVRVSRGLKLSPVQWKRKRGQFTVAAPRAMPPGLAKLEILGAERLIAPVAILPPSVRAVICQRNERARGSKTDACYLPAVDNEVQRAFTRLRTFFDETSLHFRLTCSEPRMKNLVQQATPVRPIALFNDDHVEILLATGADPGSFLQLGVNAANLGCYKPFGNSPDNLAWQHSVQRYEDRWEARVTIPFSPAFPAPKPGDAWKINVVRLRRADGRENSALVKTDKGFLCPEAFLPLKFVRGNRR